MWKALYPLWRRSGKEWETEEQRQVLSQPSAPHRTNPTVHYCIAVSFLVLTSYLTAESFHRASKLSSRAKGFVFDKSQFAVSGCPAAQRHHRLGPPTSFRQWCTCCWARPHELTSPWGHLSHSVLSVFIFCSSFAAEGQCVFMHY